MPEYTNRIAQVLTEVRQSTLPKEPTKTATFVGGTFGFGDGLTVGSVVTGQGGYLQIPVPGRIIGLQVVSSAAITASFDLRIATYDDFPTFSPLWTVLPTITAINKDTIDLSSWAIRYLSPRDWISYTITLTSGSPIRIGVGLLMVRFDSPYGNDTIHDSDSNTLSDANGNSIILRN